MSLNSFFASLQDFFYATFEILPVIGNGATWFFSLTIGALFLYWTGVLAKEPKSDK
jgi:hypothetical protein